MVSVPLGELPAFIYWVRVDEDKKGKRDEKQGFFPLNKDTGGGAWGGGGSTKFSSSLTGESKQRKKTWWN